MVKVAFLDRDGTINVDKGYVYKKEQFEFLPCVITTLKLLSQKGYKLIVITNQSGIARGFYTEEDYLYLDCWMKRTLGKLGIEIMDSYYCPHLPDAKLERYRVQCRCRKPGILLFEKAIKEYEIDIGHSIVIGDKLRDVEICRHTDMKGFVIYQEMDRVEDNIFYLRNGVEDVIKYIE